MFPALENRKGKDNGENKIAKIYSRQESEKEKITMCITPGIAVAVDKLRRSLKESKNGNGKFYETYKANIAACIADEVRAQKIKLSAAKLHTMANAAADRFLNLFIE